MKVFVLIAVFFLGFNASAQNPQVVLTTANTVVFRGVVDSSTVLTAQLKLAELVERRGAKNYPIYLVLDSPGGSIDAGLSFLEYAKNIRDLRTISIFAASMASAIAQTLPGERLALSNSTMMFHRAQGRFSGYFESGDVETTLWAAKAMVLSMELTNANRMKMDLSTYKALVQNEVWLFGKHNVEYRAADRIVDVVCTGTLIKSTATTSMSLGLFGSINLQFSNCPLIRYPIGATSARRYIVPTLRNYNYIKSKYLVSP